MSEQVLQAFRETRIVACVRTDDATVARDASLAALEGGVRVLEITLTTPGALDLIESLSKDERAVVGCGTALEPDDVRRVAEAGGKFVLSPVTDEAVIEAAHGFGLLVAPGAATPTEVHRAWRAGATVVKLFPIGQLGGPGFVRAIRGPFPHVALLPTNGVTLDLIPEYLKAGVVALGFGGELFPKDALARRAWGEVEAASRRLVAAVQAAERAAG
jgi:2-dehydro-3-deoxyphosphogluconate aldolase/(4S)-4-hydroxy-2-oxoglutarate aldolase